MVSEEKVSIINYKILYIFKSKKVLDIKNATKKFKRSFICGWANVPNIKCNCPSAIVIDWKFLYCELTFLNLHSNNVNIL